MEFKAVLLLFASVLLLTTKVSSNNNLHDRELKIKQDQSERRRSLFNLWIYPRTPYPRIPYPRIPYIFGMPEFNITDPPLPPLIAERSPKLPAVMRPVTGTINSASTPSSTPQIKTPADCVPLCNTRCKIETNKKICRRSCMFCCDRCKCVPPGDYGTNIDKCGTCYTQLKYHEHKCP